MNGEIKVVMKDTFQIKLEIHRQELELLTD